MGFFLNGCRHTSDEPTAMPWGKHKGKALATVPRNYLSYVATWDQLREPLKTAVLDELVRRGLPFGKHKGVPLFDLPDAYLQWVATNSELLPPLDTLVSGELARRKRSKQQRARLL
jgi:uncharacterized protein (DUF3820 family)